MKIKLNDSASVEPLDRLNTKSGKSKGTNSHSEQLKPRADSTHTVNRDDSHREQR